MKLTLSGQLTHEMKSAQAVQFGLMLSPGLAAAGGQSRLVAVNHLTAASRLTPLAVPPDGPAPVVNVQVNGRNFNATFPNLTVADYQVRANRRFREQVFEAVYPVAPGAVAGIPIAWQNADPFELSKGALADDYTFNAGGANEHLLSFRMSAPPAASRVYVLHKPANGKNSFVALLAELRNKQAKDVKGLFPPFTVKTAQGDLAVTPPNLVRAYAFFRYGQALRWPLPGIREWAAAAAPGGGVPDLTAVAVPELTEEELIDADIRPEYIPAEYPFAVEILVLVLKAGSPVLAAK